MGKEREQTEPSFLEIWQKNYNFSLVIVWKSLWLLERFHRENTYMPPPPSLSLSLSLSTTFFEIYFAQTVVEMRAETRVYFRV
jgi:hypothetical protein